MGTSVNIANRRQAEALGLGIGAFGYYRRVLENQKDRLFDEILKVSVRVGRRRKRRNGSPAPRVPGDSEQLLIRRHLRFRSSWWSKGRIRWSSSIRRLAGDYMQSQTNSAW